MITQLSFVHLFNNLEALLLSLKPFVAYHLDATLRHLVNITTVLFIFHKYIAQIVERARQFNICCRQETTDRHCQIRTNYDGLIRTIHEFVHMLTAPHCIAIEYIFVLYERRRDLCVLTISTKTEYILTHIILALCYDPYIITEPRR